MPQHGRASLYLSLAAVAEAEKDHAPDQPARHCRTGEPSASASAAASSATLQPFAPPPSPSSATHISPLRRPPILDDPAAEDSRSAATSRRRLCSTRQSARIDDHVQVFRRRQAVGQFVVPFEHPFPRYFGAPRDHAILLRSSRQALRPLRATTTPQRAATAVVPTGCEPNVAMISTTHRRYPPLRYLARAHEWRTWKEHE